MRSTRRWQRHPDWSTTFEWTAKEIDVLLRLLAEAEAERDDYRSDYFRRHRAACDCLEREVMLIAGLARWKADCDDTATCLTNERKRFAELLQEAHRERDAAMRVAANLTYDVMTMDPSRKGPR